MASRTAACRGPAPSIPAPEPADDGPALGVLLDERHRFFDGPNRMHFEPDVVEDGRLVRSGEPSGLNPSAGEMIEPVASEEEHAAYSWREATLMGLGRRRFSRLLRVSFRTGTNDSEATRKSSTSEFTSGMGHSSKDSPIANLRISAMSCASA